MRNQKLKQKQRSLKFRIEQQIENFKAWLINTGRTLGFFGVPQRLANRILDQDEQALINKMTNWQNHQWQRRGRSRDIEHLEYFTNLKRYR